MGCHNCCWFSTGFGDDVRGSGWCYAAEVYADNYEFCPYTDADGESFWQATLRSEPLIHPELKLVDAVARLDTEVEG